MKKSILFKSILAGALALSTFSAQANGGLFGFARSAIRRHRGIASAAATATAFGFAEGHRRSLEATTESNQDNTEGNITSKIEGIFSLGVGTISTIGGKVMLQNTVDAYRNSKKQFEKNLIRAGNITHKFNANPRAVKRVTNVMKLKPRHFLRAGGHGILGLVGTAFATLGIASFYVGGISLRESH